MSKKRTPLRREAHFQVKMYKTHHVRTTFGSWAVEKVHAVVTRSTYWSQNVQSTLRVWTTFGGSDVVSRGRRKGLWREAHCQKWAKREGFQALGVRTTTTTGGSDVAKLRFTTLHYTTLHSTTLHYTTLHYTTTTTTQLHSTTLHYTKLHYTTLHYTTLHSTTLHYITQHYRTLKDTAPQIHRYTDR